MKFINFTTSNLLRIQILLLCLFSQFILTYPVNANNSNLKAFLKLPVIFNNNMVIQREKTVNIFGSSIPGAKVNIVLNNITKTVYSDISGKWKVTFDPLAVGGPYQMKITTADTLINYTNILCGDVWLCSGQSNMDFRLNGDQFVKEELSMSTNPNLRLLTIPAQASVNKDNYTTIKNVWLQSESSSANNFSAVGYYFGKKIQTESQVPVGIICAAWGGSNILSWMSREAMSAFGEYQPFLDELDNQTVNLEELKTRANNETKRRNSALNAGLSPETSPFTPYGLPHIPTVAYNGNINPIKGFQLKGILWYQGENNVAHAWEYKSHFAALIKDWRAKFNDPNLPFYFVQLANFIPIFSFYPYANQWAELREAQDKTQAIPNTEMIVTIDIGMKDNIHPINKRDVGYRLANLALKNLYGKTQLNCEFPSFKSAIVSGSSIICELNNTGTGLKVMGGELTEFTIAGADQRFYKATAKIISQNKIEVQSKNVASPVAIRYAWSDCPENGLVFNSYDLPLGPFRTDTWQISTQPMPEKENNEIVIIKTTKAANSTLTIPMIAGGTGKVSVDWGNNVFVPVANASNMINAPTFIRSKTYIDNAEIKIKLENRYLSLLNLDNCQISKLDVGQSAYLDYLSCNVNTLDSLNLLNNPELRYLNCSNNNITTLDLHKNLNITNIQLNTNNISQLNGLNQLTFLENISARRNPLEKVDFSANQNLKTINLSNSGLTTLDLTQNDLLEVVDIYNSGINNKNNFSACGLDSLYNSLPDRTGKTPGTIRVIYSIAIPNSNDGAGSNKDIAKQKNWIVTSNSNELLTGDGGKCSLTELLNTNIANEVMEIQPNPANNFIKVEIKTQLKDKRLNIIDLTGKKIMTHDLTQDVSIIDITAIQKGIYIVSCDKYKNKLIVR